MRACQRKTTDIQNIKAVMELFIIFLKIINLSFKSFWEENCLSLFNKLSISLQFCIKVIPSYVILTVRGNLFRFLKKTLKLFKQKNGFE